MRLVDDEGRLFGRVNVIDAIVVLAAITLIIGGAFVIVNDMRTDQEADREPDRDSNQGLAPDPDAFRYAIVTYEVPLHSPSARLSPGTEFTSDGESFDIIDVHRSVTPEGAAYVTAKLVYEGEFGVGGRQVFAGEAVEFVTNSSRLQVDVQAVGHKSGIITTTESAVVIAANASSPGATAVEPGDKVRVGGDVVGTIDAVRNAPENRTHIGATVTARETVAGPAFGGRSLRIGERIGLVTDDAIVRGRIAALETDDPDEVG